MKHRSTVPQSGREQKFDWESLVPRIIHPLKTAIVEALMCIDRPLSASDLHKVFETETSLGLVSYHLQELVKIGALEKVKKRQVRGAEEKFYFFTPGQVMPEAA